MKYWFVLLFSVLMVSKVALAKNFDTARSKIIDEISSMKLDIGVSIVHVESGESISPNGHKRLPMASVYKFPIAVVLLKRVEDGKMSLDKKISVTKSDIRGGYKGPIAKKYPDGGIELSIGTLVKYMVSNSDNSATDLLLKILGGPKEVTKVLQKFGFNSISIDRYEKSLISEGNRKGELDTSSADELRRLLVKFHAGKLLNEKNTDLLRKLMTNAKTPGHIAKGLPSNVMQFHKSGWCSESKCINDVAMVTLPENKGHLAMAILVSGDIKDTEKISRFIGKIARIAFDSISK